jgi:D-alanyl-D-alanine carboxypeptidase
MTDTFPYADQAALDAAVDPWATKIDALAFDDFMALFTGTSRSAAANELRSHFIAETKSKALLLHQALAKKGLAPNQNPIASQFRDYVSQNGIWDTKFALRQYDPWNEVSAEASEKSGGNIAVGTLWDWRKADHRTLWSALTPEERQQEILIASAGPGISRHHWGSEVDFYDPSTANWQKWSALFAEMHDHGLAARHGFVGSYGRPYVYGAQYRDERWHWSYHPVSKPMLDRARRESPDEILAALTALWAGAADKSYLATPHNWLQYVTNLNEDARWPDQGDAGSGSISAAT